MRTKAEQARVEQFNRDFPVGTEVRYRLPGMRCGQKLSKVRSPAHCLATGLAVAWVEGHSKGIPVGLISR